MFGSSSMLYGASEHATYDEATMYGYSEAARLGLFLWYSF